MLEIVQLIESTSLLVRRRPEQDLVQGVNSGLYVPEEEEV